MTPTSRLQDHPQFKALKAAFDLVTSQADEEITDNAHEAILDEDVTNLMCALRLKE